MVLKKLTSNNIKNILDLEKNHAPNIPLYKKYDKKALSFIFDNPLEYEAIGLFDQDQLIGWGSYRTNWNEYSESEGVYEISSIVIHYQYRNRGLGTKILHQIIKDLKSKKFSKIYLTVSPLNIEALILYLKNNFIIYDYKADVYGKDVDRVFLSLSN